jgi:prophage regulatory protein
MRVLRLPEVEDKTGLKHTAIYDRIAAGEFPKPIPLTAKARGWIESEVTSWIAARVAARDSALQEAA